MYQLALPLDALVYHKDSLKIPIGKRIYEEDPYFSSISKQWSAMLKRSLQELPCLPLIILSSLHNLLI